MDEVISGCVRLFFNWNVSVCFKCIHEWSLPKIFFASTSKDIILHFVVVNSDKIWFNKEDPFGTVFKKVLPKTFLKFSPKKVLCTLEYIFNKVNRGMVEKPDAVGGQYCPGRLRQVFFAVFSYFSYVP